MQEYKSNILNQNILLLISTKVFTSILIISSQTERLKFRETINNDRWSPENTLQKIKNKMQAIVDIRQEKISSGDNFNQSATIRQINHNMNMVQHSIEEFDMSLAKIQKFHVEIKKIQRILSTSFARVDKYGFDQIDNRIEHR